MLVSKLMAFFTSVLHYLCFKNIHVYVVMQTQTSSWIEANFQKRECIKYITSGKDTSRCGCGQTLQSHTIQASHSTGAQSLYSVTSAISNGDHWASSRHTQTYPTDAFGIIEFQGSPHPLKAQYVRLSHDTRPELVLQLLTREWQLELPKLLISVHGGKANFELQPKLKRVLRKGFVKAAKTTGAWIFTAGTNTGVMRHVGEALLNERTPRLHGRVVTIGIAPWGIIENRKKLIGKNVVVPYHSISSPKSRLAVLNNHHSYFILVDNGSLGKYGAEIALRKKLEKYISKQKIYARSDMRSCGVPVVCVVVEGGLNTIRAVLEYVTDSPPVPVVVCDGSGRAADLLAFTQKYIQDDEMMIDNMKDQLIATIEKTFHLNKDQAEQVYKELVSCVRRKDLITVFRMGEGPCRELDQAILTALLKGHHLPPPDQLSLALTWNRADIARSEIFVYGQEWPPGSLEIAMMDALVLDRVDFVKLLQEKGVTMQKFLTIPRLEELYNTKYGPTNTLQYLVRDVKKDLITVSSVLQNIPHEYRYTLYDIGLVIEKLMGGAYRSSYCRRKFRLLYNNVMKKVSTCPILTHTMAFQYQGATNLGDSYSYNNSLFKYPFNELIIWAVLTKRHQMALYMWQNGEEALVKAIVAYKLNTEMAREAAEDDMEGDIYEELKAYAKDFETRALDLLDYCYRQDNDIALQLLTYELQNWSEQTCLGMAVNAKHSSLLAHTASQMLLADLWMGGLRTRKNTNLKVILGLLFPPTILTLDFKTKEELQLMPQTEEEHMLNKEEDEESESDTTSHEERPPLGNLYNMESLTSLAAHTVSHCSSNVRFAILENGKYNVESLPNGDLSGHTVKTKQRPLKLGKKIYEFYAAPITKFWGHTIAYGVFMCFYTYVVLVRMQPTPSWQELYVIAYLCTLGVEKIREIVCSEPVKIAQKVSVWLEKKWNPCDLALILCFLVGMALRFHPPTHEEGRVIYSMDIMYWYIRSLDFLSVNKYLGPYVTMIGKMVMNMIYFVVLLLVVLMSYGVARQSILYPYEEPSWRLARNIFHMPYWMLYGEVYADSIDPECGDGEGMFPCRTGMWLNPAIMAIYLLIANILLVNLLIAVFNNIFFEVNAISQQVWKYQRFRVVMEYEQKPVLPPPLIFTSHILLLLKFCFRRWRGLRENFDHGLKLFLDEDEVEKIHDFEEECVEGYFREKERKQQMSTDEQVRSTTERVEVISQKVEDIIQREKETCASIKSLDFRLTRLLELAEQTSTSLSVIHRFMATQMDETEAPQQTHPGRKLLDEEEPETLNQSITANIEEDYNGYHPTKTEKSQTVMRQDTEKSESPSKISNGETDEDSSSISLVLPFTEVGKKTTSKNSLLQRRLQSQQTAGCKLTRQSSVPAPAPSQDDTLGELSERPITRSNRLLRRGLSFSLSEVEEQASHVSLSPQTSVKFARSTSSGSQRRFDQDPVIYVLPASPHPPLAATRGEYTSITDDLENAACFTNLLHPSHNSLSRSTTTTSSQAQAVETEILKGAEAEDYFLMEGLIQRRLHRDSENLTVSLEELCSIQTDSDSEVSNNFHMERQGISAPAKLSSQDGTHYQSLSGERRRRSGSCGSANSLRSENGNEKSKKWNSSGHVNSSSTNTEELKPKRSESYGGICFLSHGFPNETSC
ncbi:transient receptor potential cation channel trpm-like isoform X2 [Tachypleus tridentatus]|uniref:transient receptor potential cation channel trpm-like isoform X2 n=1 Tax=Tachypleus tridentatus TaxID=6853 RepID=UPI003FD1C4D4